MEIRPQRGRKLIALQLPLQLLCNFPRISCKSCKLLILKDKFTPQGAVSAASCNFLCNLQTSREEAAKGCAIRSQALRWRKVGVYSEKVWFLAVLQHLIKLQNVCCKIPMQLAAASSCSPVGSRMLQAVLQHAAAEAAKPEAAKPSTAFRLGIDRRL